MFQVSETDEIPRVQSPVNGHDKMGFLPNGKNKA